MTKTKWCREATYLLIALVLLAGLPFMPEAAASPDQEKTFYSTIDDGFIYLAGANYFIVHGASSGGVLSGDTWLTVGQLFDSDPEFGGFFIFRGALLFNTSSLPDDACITSATLSLYGYVGHPAVDFEIIVVDGSGLHEPLVDTDYGYLGSQTVSGGSFDTSGFILGAYNDIPLNETGRGWISKTGITKFGLRSSREIDAIEPTPPESVSVFASDKGEGYQPRLIVTYTIPPPVGGEVYPVNKLAILTPWIAVGVVLAGGISWYVLRRRRAQS